MRQSRSKILSGLVLILVWDISLHRISFLSTQSHYDLVCGLHYFCMCITKTWSSFWQGQALLVQDSFAKDMTNFITLFNLYWGKYKTQFLPKLTLDTCLIFNKPVAGGGGRNDLFFYVGRNLEWDTAINNGDL